MSFSEKLIELRKKEGFSQEELAEKVNVSRQSVSKWESGQSTPEMDKLIMLSNIFNISIDELVGKEQTNNKENVKVINKESNKKHKILKVIAIIIIIYFVVFAFKFILLTRHEIIIDSFSENNYTIMESIINHDDTLPENPSYINVNITKIGNKYIETQYNTQDCSGNPSRITYVELDKKTSYQMTYDKSLNKYILDDGLKGYTEEEKDVYFKNLEDSNPVKNLSNMNKSIKLRLLNSINPFIFLNPFTNTILCIAPFNGIYKYEYNNDYLISRILINIWGTNRNSEWTFSYDYVPGHFENREIINPVVSGEYEIVEFKNLIENE